MPEIGAGLESLEGLNVEGQSPRWWGCIAVAFSVARMRLRERERQIASAIAVAIVAVVAVAAVVVVVVVVDGVGVKGCVASASTPEVHVLPSQGQRRRASRGSGVFPWGQLRRRSDPMFIE